MTPAPAVAAHRGGRAPVVPDRPAPTMRRTTASPDGETHSAPALPLHLQVRCHGPLHCLLHQQGADIGRLFLPCSIKRAGGPERAAPAHRLLPPPPEFPPEFTGQAAAR